jgi:hypothetical protein
MIIQTVIPARGFSIIYLSMTTAESTTESHGSQNHWMYSSSGSAQLVPGIADAEISVNTPPIDLAPGDFTDLTAWMDLPFTCRSTASGYSGMTIKFPLDSRLYQARLLRATSETLVGTNDVDCIVVCVAGQVSINGITLAQTQYTRVINGRTALLTSNSATDVAVIITSV